jgi:hypothetical protein
MHKSLKAEIKSSLFANDVIDVIYRKHLQICQN